jgi:hypothetical protein
VTAGSPDRGYASLPSPFRNGAFGNLEKGGYIGRPQQLTAQGTGHSVTENVGEQTVPVAHADILVLHGFLPAWTGGLKL